MLKVQTCHIDDFHLTNIQTDQKAIYKLHFNYEKNDEAFIPVQIIKGKKTGKTLVVFAGIHGDEYEGIETIFKIFQEIDKKDIVGTLIMVPIANISSYHAMTRLSKVDQKNLARTFPGKKTGTYSERLAWYLQEKFIKEADFLIDLHSGGDNYCMPPMVGYYNTNDVDMKLSKSAAEIFGMDTIWGHEKVGKGRTVSSATEHNVPWLYTEGYGGKRILQNELHQFKQGVHNVMHFLNMYTNSKESFPSNVKLRIYGDGDLDKAQVALYDGYFISKVNLLDKVEVGTIIGEIVNEFGLQKQQITANTNGIIMMLRGTRKVTKGDGIYTTAQTEKGEG